MKIHRCDMCGCYIEDDQEEKASVAKVVLYEGNVSTKFKMHLCMECAGYLHETRWTIRKLKHDEIAKKGVNC